MDANTNKIHTAEQYNINKIELISVTGKSVELNNLFMEINLYEGLFSNSLTGNIIISDALNLRKYLPIVGQEKLIFSFNTPGYAKKTILFDVFKISDIQSVKDEQETYILHIATPELRKNIQRRISKSYKGFYHEMVEQVVNDEIVGLGPLNRKRLIKMVDGPDVQELGVDRTKFYQKVVVPNWNPYRFLNWIAARSVAEDSLGANFVFYETTEGLHFECIEKLVGLKPIEELRYEPKNAISNKLEIDNIDSYMIKSHFDTFANAANGMYANTLITHDIIRRKIETKTFDYRDSFVKWDHLENEERKGVKTHQFIYSVGESLTGNPNSQINVYPKHKSGYDGISTNNVEDWLQFRQAQLMEMDNHKMLLVMPGNTNYRAGQVLKFNIPEVEALNSNEGTKKKDPHFSGRYLIVSLRHIFKQQRHKMVLEISKDSLLQPYPEFKEPGYNQILKRERFIE